MKLYSYILFLALITCPFVHGATLAKREKVNIYHSSPETLERISKSKTNKTIKRQRFFKIDPLKVKDEKTISIELFDGKVIQTQVTGLKVRGPFSFSWFGRSKTNLEDYVILSVVQGDLAGRIQFEGTPYHISYMGDGIYSLKDFNHQHFHPCGNTEDHTVHSEEKFSPERKTETKGNDSSVVDLLIVYSQEAKGAFGNIRTEIQSGIDSINTAYANSGIAHRVRLAGMRELNYNESGSISTDLSRLIDPDDGHMDNVHTLRNDHCADLVNLWISDDSSSCGLAQLITNPQAASAASNGFGVVVGSCAVGNLSFAHEIGHNMGARHDIGVSPADGWAAYSHGLINDLNWRTVMAYATNCTGQVCPRVSQISNPDVNYQGTATGNVSQADNARTHDETVQYVATFRTDTCVRSFYEVDALDQEEDNLVNSDCFIATAAFGSPFHTEIDVLRDFRDSVLLKSEFGKWIVHKYYLISPPIADFISLRKWAMTGVRIALLPLIFLVSNPYLSLTLVLMGMTLCLLFVIKRRQV